MARTMKSVGRDFRCVYPGCSIDSSWGQETCRAHFFAWQAIEDRAMDAALEFGDAQPDPEAYWAAVDADPAWRRAWWERKPAAPYRYIPAASRASLALRHGCAKGATVPAQCMRCGAGGEVTWTGEEPRFLRLHIDHVHPVSKGGTPDPDNLQLLCPACNIRKGARLEAV